MQSFYDLSVALVTPYRPLPMLFWQMHRIVSVKDVLQPVSWLLAVACLLFAHQIIVWDHLSQTTMVPLGQFSVRDWLSCCKRNINNTVHVHISALVLSGQAKTVLFQKKC